MPTTRSLRVALLFCCMASSTRFASAAPARPNVLFAISDDQSWMHVGAYGDRATRTPSFDRIADEGVLFSHAYAAAPSCAPSRAAILTGRNIWELEEAGNLMGVLKSSFALFTLDLQKSGYELAATGKTWGPGRLEGFGAPGTKLPARSYISSDTESITGKAFNQHRLEKRRRGIYDRDYARNFEAFLADRDPSKPFFFWYGALEPHQDYDTGAWKRAGKKLEDARLPGCLPDDPVTRGEILDHGLEIEHFDRHLGRMLAVLEKRGELANTLVIVTSDHGNPLPRSKCNLYDSGVRVPLAARWPAKIPAGRTIDDLVNLTDIAPTLLETAGLRTPREMSGRSLWPLLSSTRSGRIDPSRDFVVTAFERHIITRRDGVGYPMRSIRTHRYAYIRNYEPDRWPAGDPDFLSSHQRFYGDCDKGSTKSFLLRESHRADIHPYFLLAFGRRPAEELYDMQSDPDQLRNISSDPRFESIKSELASRLQSYLRERGDPRLRGESPWDTYPFIDEAIFRHDSWRTRGKAGTTPIRDRKRN